MKDIVYTPSSKEGVDWLYKYYAGRPDLAKKGLANFFKAENLIRSFPETGYPIGKDRRQKSISNTPFVFIYRITEKAIVVLRVKDTRGNR